MYALSRKRVCVFFLLLLFSAGYGIAQNLSVQYLQVPGISFRNPVFIGKTIQGVAIIDLVSFDSAALYVVDTNLQLVSTKMLPSAAYEAHAFTRENEVHFMWQQRSGDSARISLWQVKEDGALVITAKKEAPPGNRRVFQQLATDKKNRYSFFYTLFGGPQQLVLRGVLFDSSLQRLKKVEQSFEYDAETQRLAPILLDAKGNLHLVIYDKLTNYRLSSGIQVYTFPVGSEKFITETYRFDKAKFYDLIFFDNPFAEQVQLAGFYYNGATKIKEGLATIGLPYERRQPVVPKFHPLTQEQRNQLQQKMQHVRRKNDVMDFVKLKDIIEEDGQVYLSTWILDVPNYLLVKDNEREDATNTDMAKWLRPGKDGPYESRMQGSYPQSGFSNSSSFSNVLPQRDVNSLQPGGNRFLSSPQQPSIQNFQAGRPGMAGSSPFDLKIKWVRPHKFAFFSLDNRQDSLWCRILPADFPVTTASYQPWLWDYPMAENGHLSFIHINQPQPKNNGSPVSVKQVAPSISFVRIGARGTNIQTISPLVTTGYRFSKPFRISAGKYFSIYRQIENAQTGIAVIEIREEKD